MTLFKGIICTLLDLFSWLFSYRLNQLIEQTAYCKNPYIHLNPVKVNIVKNPFEYKWFGYISSKQEFLAFTLTMPLNPSSPLHFTKPSEGGGGPYILNGLLKHLFIILHFGLEFEM